VLDHLLYKLGIESYTRPPKCQQLMPLGVQHIHQLPKNIKTALRSTRNRVDYANPPETQSFRLLSSEIRRVSPSKLVRCRFAFCGARGPQVCIRALCVRVYLSLPGCILAETDFRRQGLNAQGVANSALQRQTTFWCKRIPT
jgi:hypothetical protein